MSTVSLMTSLMMEDCSRFLPPQHRTLDHRLFEDVSVAQQDPLMTQNAYVVHLEDRRHGAGRHSDTSGQDPSDTEMPVLPAWKIFAVVHEASAAGGVEEWSGHTDSHWTLIVLLHSSPTATGIAGTTEDQPMLHSQSPASIIPEQLRWTGRFRISYSQNTVIRTSTQHYYDFWCTIYRPSSYNEPLGFPKIYPDVLWMYLE